MTDERRTGGIEYEEFTERRDMAERVELILDSFDFKDGEEQGVRLTDDIPIVPSREFDKLYPESTWTLRFEVEHVGIQPVHVICRIVCTGKTDGDEASVTEVVYGFDTREYVRKGGEGTEDPQIVDVTDIWRYVRSGQPDETGRSVTWHSKVGVMVPSVLEGGERVVLVPEQIGGKDAYANRSDMAFLTIFLDQAGAYGDLHRNDEPGVEEPAKDLGKAGVHLVYSDKRGRV